MATKHDREEPFAFDLLELDGQELRAVTLEERKERVSQLLAGISVGILCNEMYNQSGKFRATLCRVRS